MIETGNRTSPSTAPLEATSGPIDESSHIATTITAEELGDALINEEGGKIKEWIADGRITESTLGGRLKVSIEDIFFEDLPSGDADFEFSLIEFLDRVPPILFVNGTAAALIGLMSKDQVNEVGQDGKTPLTRFAADDRGKYVTQALIDRGANANAVDRNNRTALIHNIVSGDSDGVTATLCEAGAELNVRDKDGRTAMHFATSGHNTMQILALTGAGADKTVKDNDGLTPLDLAEKCVEDEPSNADAASTLHAVSLSQEESLSLLSRLLGQDFCEKLRWASTTAWDLIASALSYAVNVFPSKAVASEEEFAVPPPVPSFDDDFDDASDFDGVTDESMSDDDEGFLPGEANRFESERVAAGQRVGYENVEPPEGFWVFDEPRGGLRSNDGEISTSAHVDKPKGV